MPTNRKRIPHNRKLPLQQTFINYFLTGDRGNDIELFLSIPKREMMQKSWFEYRDTLLTNWIAEHPGSRPFAWWDFESVGKREKLGGSGVAPWDVGLSYIPCFFKGVPKTFCSYDEEDPPVYESEASYLQRYGLLNEEEEKKLTDADFKPQTILEINEDFSIVSSPGEIDNLLERSKDV